jgi:signal transduction histidine kinase
VVYLAEDGQLRQSAVAHVDTSREPMVRSAHRALMTLPGPAVTLVQKSFDTGKVTVAVDYDLKMVESASPSETCMEELRQLDPHSIVAVPLMIEGRAIGVVGLAYCGPGRHYDETDLVLVRSLFERAALALENARLCRDLTQALQTRDDMLAVVAHDLRNPLSSIRLYASLLLRKLTNGELRGYVAGQELAARNMLRLVDDLLDAAALDAGAVTLELDQHPVGALIDQAMTSVVEAAARRKVSFEVDAERPSARVRCDAQRMVQVLSNLLSNAVRFSPEGGVVQLFARVNDARVELGVADAGPGIAPDLREHLFQRYWKGQKLGTGLGLYIAKRIVDAHGGRLTVESQPGRGATFTVVL